MKCSPRHTLLSTQVLLESGHFLHLLHTGYTFLLHLLKCLISWSLLWLEPSHQSPLLFPALSLSFLRSTLCLLLSPCHPSRLVFHGFFTLFHCYWSSSKRSMLSWLQPGAGRERLWAKPALGERCKTMAVRWKQNESSESFSRRGTVFSTVPWPSMTFVSSGIRPLQPEGWIHPALSWMQSLVSLQTGCP